jgi:predicted TPR repeat methyltransferase
VARYRSLRAEVARGRYDFTETPVYELAQSLAARGQTPAALAPLGMNQELHPSSEDVDMAFAEAYRRAGDRDDAIARYRAVLTNRPDDVRARQRLEELGADAAVRNDP